MEVWKMILGIQIFGVLFGLFMIYYSFLKLKKKEFSNSEFIFWSVSWIVLIFLVLFPHSLDFFVKGVLQMSRTLDFFIIIGFVLLIGLGFYTYSIVKKLDKRMERLVREVAFERKKK
jgi:hypothetical protein